jgi:hypothetical protein
MHSNWIRGAISGLVVVFGWALAPAEAAPILQGTPTLLTGVNGLVVDGLTYNMTFVDGTCVSVYGACDAAHFTFTTNSQAYDAAAALFAAISGTYFDTNSGIVGCPSTQLCAIYIPYSTTDLPPLASLGVVANRYPGFGSDSYFAGGLYADPTTSNTSTFPDGVWSVWSTQSAIPEPFTLSLFGAGLAGAGAARRRRWSAKLA